MLSTNEQKPKGAFCVIVHKRLAVTTCPLPKGNCMWKHRLHGQCTYSEEFANSEFSSNDFALRVGLPPIDSEIYNILKTSLAHKIKHELLD